MAIGIEDIDEAKAATRHIILPIVVLLGVGYIKITIKVLDTKRCETRRQARVAERTRKRDRFEILVEDDDFVIVKIRCVEEMPGTIRSQGKTFINRTGS